MNDKIEVENVNTPGRTTRVDKAVRALTLVVADEPEVAAACTTALLGGGSDPAVRKVRDHHLRQWYVLGDLYDRSGDVLAARHWFSMVAAGDPQYGDVDERLRSLGR